MDLSFIPEKLGVPAAFRDVIAYFVPGFLIFIVGLLHGKTESVMLADLYMNDRLAGAFLILFLSYTLGRFLGFSTVVIMNFLGSISCDKHLNKRKWGESTKSAWVRVFRIGEFAKISPPRTVIFDTEIDMLCSGHSQVNVRIERSILSFAFFVGLLAASLFLSIWISLQYLIFAALCFILTIAASNFLDFESWKAKAVILKKEASKEKG